jgi:peptidoglycan/LPS O-acetylase OafA/YrhL
MTTPLVQKNSLDLLRLVAASWVLYSHQHALMGQAEPLFFGWTTFGGAGVTIFFFLSGMLVWSSWVRDADVRRFFVRRSLRIFPALWFVVAVSVFLIGPVFSTLGLMDYWGNSLTWRYLSTALLVVRHSLPGVFSDNPYPASVNGSLWTLPVEFLCYFTVAALGCVPWSSRRVRIALGLCFSVLLASFAPQVLGLRFVPHFEMIATFWAGVYYSGVIQSHEAEKSTHVLMSQAMAWGLGALALLGFAFLSDRGLERTAMLACAAVLVQLAFKLSAGAKLTDRLGDLSYGVYIFAFPVQQIVVHWGRGSDWSFGVSLAMSFVLTGVLAFASWHLLEKQALRFKPKASRI